MQKGSTQKKTSLQRRGRPAQQVRIIGGLWKRTPLPVLEAEGLRPTPDRVRETLFNWLNHLFDGEWTRLNCLDLFAGTGALGFEAGSRGAARVLMVEDNPAAIRQLEASKAKLNANRISIQRGDALTVAQGLAQRVGDASSRFDLIFLDPPYHHEWLVKILPVCAQLLSDDGLIYAESEVPLDAQGPTMDWLADWNVVRADKAGMVFFHVLRRNNTAEIQA